MLGPEALARRKIDHALCEAGWVVQDSDGVKLSAARGVAVREVSLAKGHGTADYILFADRRAIGAVEAKKAGATLTGVEIQSNRYSEGLPAKYPAWQRPLPFLYESTGYETQFTNGLDPEPRSRGVFAFHRPETLLAWIGADQGGLRAVAETSPPYDGHPTFLRRMRAMPPLDDAKLWPAQRQAVLNLERSLRENRPRALVQMATGSGKTFTAISSIYRLLRYGKAKRVLFLVDRANLGRQTFKEFQQYETPDDGRKFTELYIVQHLQNNRIDDSARVVITTIQRLYSVLRGDPDLADPELDEVSLFDPHTQLVKKPVEIDYNPAVPIETFDIIFTDECHRSIYHLWRQVLEYFDAYLIGLTATPSKQTLGFFNQNLVMEYGHEQAVADNVNVPFDVYRIRTRITEGGSSILAGEWVGRRERATRRKRWEELDEDETYSTNDLDRSVVAEDQIRTVIRTFRDKVGTEIFPGRTEVPKTLIFAKDDNHADDIVRIVREEFGRGNDFAQKITYRTTGDTPENLIQRFRTSFNPRIVVTVDMIATGTDIKPLEIVLFMRSVKSRNFFEQMKGRGARVMNDADFQGMQLAEDATSKTHFVIVDAVGVSEQPKFDTTTLERKKSVPLKSLLQEIGFGSVDPDTLSTLASRLLRLDKQLSPGQRKELTALAAGVPPREIARGIIEALDPDTQIEAARLDFDLGPDETPTEAQQAQTGRRLLEAAIAPVADNPTLRNRLEAIQRQTEQTIDEVSKDAVLQAGFSADAAERARQTVTSFEQYLTDHRDEITAIQLLYSRP